MENVSEAVLMAGQILIFIIALSICMSSLTIVRVEIDRIVGSTETVQMAKNGNTYINYLQSESNKATRKVGVETVASSMCRAIKENYVVYIIIPNDDWTDTALIAADVDKVKFNNNIEMIVNGIPKTIYITGNDVIKTTIGQNTNQNINEKLNAGLYKYLMKNDKQFYEHLGEYQNYTAGEGVTPENKQTYRIITYIESTLIDN